MSSSWSGCCPTTRAVSKAHKRRGGAMERQSGWCRLGWIAWTATLAMMVVSPGGEQSPEADGPQQWQSLNAQEMEAYQAGDYSKGIALAEKALGLARQAFGDREPRTLSSLNNLALLYKAQGRYGEAKPLYHEALQARREVLGPRHPDTLTSLSNLALLYQAQGHYGEAEPPHQETLQARRKVRRPPPPPPLPRPPNPRHPPQPHTPYTQP